jgi:hypothetical protein
MVHRIGAHRVFLKGSIAPSEWEGFATLGTLRQVSGVEIMATSSDIRARLRRVQGERRDPRQVHALARAHARERLHLDSRPRRPRADRDLLWDAEGNSYKVRARTVHGMHEGTMFELGRVPDEFDYLLGVFLHRDTLRLLGIIRLPWSAVLWLGSESGGRYRLPWGGNGPVHDLAEFL